MNPENRPQVKPCRGESAPLRPGPGQAVGRRGTRERHDLVLGQAEIELAVQRGDERGPRQHPHLGGLGPESPNVTQ